jgi:hypothetical protein
MQSKFSRVKTPDYSLIHHYIAKVYANNLHTLIQVVICLWFADYTNCFGIFFQLKADSIEITM